jgi:hypothetical protein
LFGTAIGTRVAPTTPGGSALAEGGAGDADAVAAPEWLVELLRGWSLDVHPATVRGTRSAAVRAAIDRMADTLGLVTRGAGVGLPPA